MTMHLARGLSTIHTGKRKQKKRTKAQQEKLIEEHRAFNKRMKQAGRHSERLTFDEYVERVCGKGEKVKQPSKQSPLDVKTYVHKLPDTSRGKEYKSLDSGKGVALKQESTKYTGTLVKGIATMHKSNAVPVINQEEAESISQMRRN